MTTEVFEAKLDSVDEMVKGINIKLEDVQTAMEDAGRCAGEQMLERMNEFYDRVADLMHDINISIEQWIEAKREDGSFANAHNGATLLALAEDDTLLCLLPLGHVFGFVCGLLWGLYSGACVALGRGPRHYAEDCAYYKPTAVSVVPLLLGFLLKNHALNPELKLILIGAGDCPSQILDAARTTGARISFGYGLTETSSGVALSLGDDPYAMTVCPDDTVTIADDGEILISAPTCIMKGYYKMPEATGAVLRYGMLRSGDLGRIDKNGLLHITGRKKDILVLSDGTKIFLPEYELQLMQALRRSELAVILQGGRPVLLCQTVPGDSEDPAKRRTAVLKLLAPFMKSMPRGQQITDVFFTDAPLPRTATGKIKRYELPQLIAELLNQ